MDYVFQYVQDNGGLDFEEFYLYEVIEEFCKYNFKYFVVNDIGFVDIFKQEKVLMKVVVIVGFIFVVIDVGYEFFLFYKEGIYFELDCSSEDMDYGVLVVGYGFESIELDNNKYWLVKNSWGEEWGMGGYVKMVKDWRNYCGIVLVVSYFIV